MLTLDTLVLANEHVFFMVIRENEGVRFGETRASSSLSCSFLHCIIRVFCRKCFCSARVSPSWVWWISNKRLWALHRGGRGFVRRSIVAVVGSCGAPSWRSRAALHRGGRGVVRVRTTCQHVCGNRTSWTQSVVQTLYLQMSCRLVWRREGGGLHTQQGPSFTTSILMFNENKQISSSISTIRLHLLRLSSILCRGSKGPRIMVFSSSPVWRSPISLVFVKNAAMIMLFVPLVVQATGSSPTTGLHSEGFLAAAPAQSSQRQDPPSMVVAAEQQDLDPPSMVAADQHDVDMVDPPSMVAPAEMHDVVQHGPSMVPSPPLRVFFFLCDKSPVPYDQPLMGHGIFCKRGEIPRDSVLASIVARQLVASDVGMALDGLLLDDAPRSRERTENVVWDSLKVVRDHVHSTAQESAHTTLKEKKEILDGSLTAALRQAFANHPAPWTAAIPELVEAYARCGFLGAGEGVVCHMPRGLARDIFRKSIFFA